MVFCTICALYKNSLKAKWKRRLLFLAMAFYLLPIGACKQQICEWIGGIALALPARNRLEGRIDTSYVVARIGDERIALGNQRYLESFILISAVVTAVMILYRIYRYHIHKKQMKKRARQAVTDEQQILFKNAKEQLSVKTNVEIWQSPDIAVPFTAGIFKPAVWLPENADAYSVGELKSVVYHELAHIKHRDLFLYVAGMLVVAVHWFNPFSYLFFHYLRVNGEQYSDETAAAQMTEQEKIRYCEMLIRISEESAKRVDAGAGFSAQSKTHIRRRMDLIMSRTRKNIWIAVAAGVIGGAMSTAVAFAYEAPQELALNENDDESDALAEQYFWITGESATEAQLYDKFFKDGEIEELCCGDRQLFSVVSGGERSVCRHRYVNGEQMRYRSDGAGGCRVNYYYAKRCITCGSVVTGERYHTYLYEVCPHKKGDKIVEKE